MKKSKDIEKEEAGELENTIIEEEEIDQSENQEEDFNLEEDIEPIPLTPKGVYHAHVTKIDYDEEDNFIMWEFTLVENDGYMSDEITPIDGSVQSLRNYLPNPEDKDNLTKSGKQTIYQSKLRFLKEHFDKLGIKAKSLSEIREAVDNQDWLGMSVDVTIEPKVWKNRIFDNIVDLKVRK